MPLSSFLKDYPSQKGEKSEVSGTVVQKPEEEVEEDPQEDKNEEISDDLDKTSVQEGSEQQTEELNLIEEGSSEKGD